MYIITLKRYFDITTNNLCVYFYLGIFHNRLQFSLSDMKYKLFGIHVDLSLLIQVMKMMVYVVD